MGQRKLADELPYEPTAAGAEHGLCITGACGIGGLETRVHMTLAEGMSLTHDYCLVLRDVNALQSEEGKEDLEPLRRFVKWRLDELVEGGAISEQRLDTLKERILGREDQGSE